MNDYNGEMTLTSDSGRKELKIGVQLPAQKLILTEVRVEFDTDEHALAEKIIYIDLPFFDYNKLVDNTDYTYLPVLLGPTKVTHKFSMFKPLLMTQPLRERFTMRVLDHNFVEIDSKLVSITLQFNIISAVSVH